MLPSLLRYANSNLTMNFFTHPVSTKEGWAKSRAVEMILPRQNQSAARAGVAWCVFS